MLKYNDLSKIKCVVFDLDGTIYFGSDLAEKANEVIQKIRLKYSNIFFITNNSSKTRKQVWEKLVEMGIDVKFEEVINSAYVTAKYLKENNYNDVYCIGTKDLADEIASFGVNPKSKNPKAVVVGFDSEFKLSSLEDVLSLPNQDYKIIIANQERVYPRDNGIITPGAGAVVAAVEYSLNKKTDLVTGKPNPLMLQIITKDLALNPEEILIIGDSYDSDIKMAKAFGAQSILITNNNDIECDCDSVKQLKDLLELL